MALAPAQRGLKRGLDVLIALPLLVATSPLLLAGAAAARLSTGGTAIFRQTRIGLGGRPFTVYKLRTMRASVPSATTVTTAQDPRITRVGSILRALKLDELPQLWNVIRGDMSLVGPRPDVPGWADALTGADRAILDLRPGITAPASLAWRHEECELAAVQQEGRNAEEFNRTVIWPSKVRLNRWYQGRWSVWLDLRVLARTALGGSWPRPYQQPVRVLHLIGNLRTGGAEAMLLRLVEQQMKDGLHPRVVSLVSEGTMAERLRALGVPVCALGARKGLADPRLLWRVRAQIRAACPDVVHAWMYHSCLLAVLARGHAPRPAVVWNIRTSADPRQSMRGLTRATMRLCAWLSACADAVVYNAERARANHAARGFGAAAGASGAAGTVIPNGFDTEAFQPDGSARAAVRAELGVPLDARDAPVIGIVARVHAVKRHDLLLAAMDAVLERHPGARLLAAGSGTESLAAHPAATPRAARALLPLGERADTARVMNACDVLVCCSDDEGFSNVVGEALCCGIPQVVTDVGDSGAIVGTAGATVPPGDASALAAALERLLAASADDRAAMGRQGRARACQFFGIGAVARRFEETYRAAVRRRSCE